MEASSTFENMYDIVLLKFVCVVVGEDYVSCFNRITLTCPTQYKLHISVSYVPQLGPSLMLIWIPTSPLSICFIPSRSIWTDCLNLFYYNGSNLTHIVSSTIGAQQFFLWHYAAKLKFTINSKENIHFITRSHTHTCFIKKS